MPYPELVYQIKARSVNAIRERLRSNGNTQTSTWADLDKVLGPIEWAWPGWLPKGMLTILVGQSGMGKSILALRIAQCFLSGAAFPDDTRYKGELGEVLWCEAEAAQALNLERAAA